MTERSVIIIGGGMAGLAAGCYARMNGYLATIFEMHDQPGGLCTAWQRQGYTIDGCLHWLVGSSPASGFHRIWQELGALQGQKVIDLDQFYRCEDSSGNAFTVYTDVDRLEQHMKALSPEDGKAIDEFCGTVRRFTRWNVPVDKAPEVYGLSDGLKSMAGMVPFAKDFLKLGRTSMANYVTRFRHPLIRQGLLDLWPPEFGAFFVVMTLAWMHMKSAGYVIGGSLPLAQRIEQRYLGLGGNIQYKARVARVLTENGRAIGVRLVDGSEYRADYVLSAADGHSTIFEMLEGRYLDDKVQGYFHTLPIFQPLVYIALGVNRTFDDVPPSISGMEFPLEKPLMIGGTSWDRLMVRIHSFDPTLAPAGKTLLTVMIPGTFDFWQKLRQDMNAYRSEKARVADMVVAALSRRFIGLASQVEMRDVATPVTFHRYTGNWQGSFEGWLVTPKTLTLRMSKTLPGLDNFYMCGQWVEPGGGLPTAAKSGRDVIQILCKRDKREFATTVPS